MPRYKLIFQNVSWQSRKFISVTKMENDGSVHTINCVTYDEKGCHEYQASFGSYAANASDQMKQGLDFSRNQSQCMFTMMGNQLADEKTYQEALNNEDMLERIYRDEPFLDELVRHEKDGNHSVLINAAQDLKRGVCAKSIGLINDTHYPEDYRKYVFAHYCNYLFNLGDARVNAHPAGLFTEIHVTDEGSDPVLKNSGANQLSINSIDARTVLDHVFSLLTHNDKTGYMFAGLPTKFNAGAFLEITEPSANVIATVEQIFDFAAKRGFFPNDSREMVRNTWNARSQQLLELEFAPPQTPTIKPSLFGGRSSPVKEVGESSASTNQFKPS